MKYIVIILLLITMTGCKGKDNNNQIKKIDKVDAVDNKGYGDDYNDTNPIKVGLYYNYKLVLTNYMRHYSDCPCAQDGRQPRGEGSRKITLISPTARC